ncbi:MAG: hypothetical protein ACI9G1_000744 [Pirellulaceae bacterium]|jgi:hypothetical protein
MSQEVWDMLELAERMSAGPAQISLCEEVVRLADVDGDVELRMSARMELVKAAMFGGAPDRALIEFIWCLAKYDSDSEEFAQYSYNLMWQFKWVMDRLCDFPSVPKEKIRQLEDDMERHYRIEDHGMRAVHQIRWVNALGMGDLNRFREYWDKWCEVPRDAMADCLACEQNKRVEAAIAQLDYEQAFQYAKPIFAGRMSCAEIPQKTYATVMPALLKLGRLDEATEYFNAGYRQIRGNPVYLVDLAGHLLFLTYTKSFVKGLNMVERHLPWAIDSPNKFWQFEFYSTASLLVQAMAQSVTSPKKLKLPRELSCFREEGVYQLADVAKCLSEQASEIEAIFNRRNENDHFTKLRESYRALVVS